MKNVFKQIKIKLLNKKHFMGSKSINKNVLKMQ